jgi:amidophosphoribosyltransferase
MAGIFGIVSKENCIADAFYGTFYLQHRAQDYCGIGLYNGKILDDITHRGLIKQQFPKNIRNNLFAHSSIGVVSTDRQPVAGLSKIGGILLGFDGNIINHLQLRNKLFMEGRSFDGYYSPEKITDAIIVSKIISSRQSFEGGIERLVEEIQGDFSIVALTERGIYAARGWGRKPLIFGQKENSYAVSSESNSFVNTGFKIVRDVEPGEIVLVNNEGFHTIKKLNLSPVKYGTFEWIYTSHPASVIDGKNVASVRKKIGAALARRYPVDADIVSGIPNSGRWHGNGYSEESGIPYEEVFVRFDYSDRSFTPQEDEDRAEEGDKKLIVLEEIVKGKRIVIVDDSIVRGTQTLNQTGKLKEKGAKEIHGRIACPPLMSACKYGKTTRIDEECIARRMNIEEIRKTRELDSLGYATLEDLEEAIGFPREKLCLECWKM